jgi:hypothetical protein
MNRRARRRAAALSRKRHNRFYLDYIAHLPEIPLDVPLERGRVYHQVYAHDDRCPFYETENLADCTCSPIVRRFVEPERS